MAVQQPKITGDAQVDSWALRITQEVNSLETTEETTSTSLSTIPVATNQAQLNVVDQAKVRGTIVYVIGNLNVTRANGTTRQINTGLWIYLNPDWAQA